MGRSPTRWKKMSKVYNGVLTVGANAAAYITWPIAVDRVLAWIETGDAAISWKASNATTGAPTARPGAAASPGATQSGIGTRMFNVGEAQILEANEAGGIWHFYNHTGSPVDIRMEAGASATVDE